jgi:phage terminase large subunit-like protein
MVERCFREERIHVDEEQLERYMSYQKYFPFHLFPWERFCFALHNCVYTADNRLRWPLLVIYVGRGAGKNGYLGFEDFCLLTDTNGVGHYNIDLFAMSELQAKTSWQDVYDVLEANERKMRKHFRWTKETIVNTDTNSVFSFHTSSPKTKDGFRPGKVDFDEYHAYESYRLVDVAVTGLGKRPRPRRTIITTDGNVRGGPLDELKDTCLAILHGEEADNGTLPFLCRLDDPEEVHDQRMWHKANPSLQYLSDLMSEMQIEYAAYRANPTANASFMTKRMNCPPRASEGNIAPWEQILATNQPIDEGELNGLSCVAGLDYASTTDMIGAGLLFHVGARYVWVTHTWVCSRSHDLSRIHAPLDEWSARGLLTFVDAPEVPATLPAAWLSITAARLNAYIAACGLDSYRYQLMRLALSEIGLTAGREGNIRLLRPSDEMKAAPVISSAFANSAFVWGDNPLMRWAAWNSKLEVNKLGNMTYGKIEPKSRKTDPFKALVAAMCVSDRLEEDAVGFEDYVPAFGDAGVFTFDD